MKMNLFIQKCEHSPEKSKIIPRLCSNSTILSSKEGLIYCWIFPQKNLYRF
jgi:hypothetical protein